MPTQYGRLRASSDSHETPLGKEGELFHQRWWSKERWIIAVQTAVIGLLSVVVVLLSLQSGNLNTPRRSFATDFGNLGDVVPFKQQTFINPLRPTSDFSALKMEWKEGEPRFTGQPGPELDANWDKLLAMTTFNITGDAAQPAVGNTYQYEDGKYAMGLEVFHALHCVNNIRMMLHPENYELNEPKDETDLHKAHCLDYLRQYVQCNADLTPFWGDFVPKYRLVLRPYTPHTCRDFSRLTEWISHNAEIS